MPHFHATVIRMGRKIKKLYADWRAAEIGEKPNREGSVRVIAVYPGPYHVAMANLGYQWLIHSLSRAGYAVNRIVYPPDEIITEIENGTLPAIDDERPAREAAAWFVSVSFENDLIRLAALLRLAGLAYRSADRAERDPLIVVGGIVPMLNPEPAADLADICLLGEGEAALPPFLNRFADYRPADKSDFLQSLNTAPGAYVGRFYRPQYREDGRLLSVEAQNAFPSIVRVPKAAAIDVDLVRTHLRAPKASFGDALLMEISRGCIQRCRFCAAGHLYLPYRAADLPESGLPDLGQQALGLVGANVSGHPQLESWIELAGNRRVTLSSIRVGALNADGWRRLIDKGLASAALAPETGTDRLRCVCNKAATNEEILEEILRAATAGLRNFKLYFLVGLPTETEADLEAIVGLSMLSREAAMRGWKSKGRAGHIAVSLNPLIPKPQTPFQWHPFGDPQDLQRRINLVKKGLRGQPNIQIQAESMPEAILQAILSTGDRRVADLIYRAAEARNTRAGLRQWKGNQTFYLQRRRAFDETLPWDHIDAGVSRRYLEREYESALAGRMSPQCFKVPNCRLCGACG